MRKSSSAPLSRFRPLLVLGLGLLVTVGGPCLRAQTPNETEDNSNSTATNVPFWQVVTPAGNFTVALKNISSVSVHTYMVDATARVTELNVGTNGSLVARFYYLEAISESSPLATLQVAQNRVRETAESANSRVLGGSAPWENVVKNYPTTTHAHTVEYRLPTKDLVDKLFEDAEKAWMTGKGSKVTVAAEK
jgi:hypothetical protein